MRVAFATEGAEGPLRDALAVEAGRFGLDWTLVDPARAKRVILMVSKFDHCLGDLLYRHRIGELPMDPVAIVSNHPAEALNLTVGEGVPYHHLPVTKATKAAQEAQVRALVEETGAELVVLARYMQILSDEMPTSLDNCCSS